MIDIKKDLEIVYASGDVVPVKRISEVSDDLLLVYRENHGRYYVCDKYDGKLIATIYNENNTQITLRNVNEVKTYQIGNEKIEAKNKKEAAKEAWNRLSGLAITELLEQLLEEVK
jgi:glucose dehydrogenase